MPAATPVITPDNGLIEVIEPFALLHVPATIVLKSVVEDPSQTTGVPAIAGGSALMVTGTVT